MTKTGWFLGVLVLAVAAAAWLVLRDDTPSDFASVPATQSQPGAGPLDAEPPAASPVGMHVRDPGDRRDVRITVVEGAALAPVVNAQITVHGADLAKPAPTNDLGRTWIRRMPPTGPRLRIEVTRSDSPMRPQQFDLPRSKRALTLELPVVRALTWKIIAPSPPEGSTVVIRPANDGQPVRVLVTNGALALTWGSGPFAGWAEAPDGTVASLRCSRREDVGDPVKFLPARTLTAHLTLPNGRPAAGYEVEVRANDRAQAFRSETTDAAGVAVLRRLPPFGVNVWVHFQDINVPILPPTASGFPRTLDLTKDDVTWKATVAWPARYQVVVEGLSDLSLLARSQVFIDGQRARLDAIVGNEMTVVWFRLDARAPSALSLRIPGYEERVQEVTSSAWEHPTRVRFHIASALQLYASVPHTWPTSSVLQRRHADGLWHLERDIQGFKMLNAPVRFADPMKFLIGDLKPGAYRLMSPKSLVTTSPVEVRDAADIPITTVTSWSRKVKAKIELVDKDGTVLKRVSGLNPLEVAIYAQPTDEPALKELPLVGRPMTRDWTASLKVPVGRELRLTADHPTWKPPSDTPSVVLREDMESVTLRLMAPRVHQLRLSGASQRLPNSGPTLREIPMHFWRTVDGAVVDVQRGRGRVLGHMVTFVSPKPDGVYEVFLDTAPFAPIVVHGIGFDGRPLGLRKEAGAYLPHDPRPLVEGGSLRFRRAHAGEPLVARAVHQGTPRYVRNMVAKDDGRLYGLGPGRFDVVVRALHDSEEREPLWSGVIESDGSSEQPIEITK